MFRTELTIAPATGQLLRTARVLTVGSCFADSIGSRLAANKVETLVNPFGTVFQPLALARLLRAAAGEDVDWQQHLVEARGRWQSYDLHGSIGADSPVALLQNIQELVRHTGEFLRNADVVLLTLGTAWAYRLRETGELVNNCHKQSADLFVRELLTPDEIINALAETHAYLRRINPELRFVLTVSPVRHLKDTLQLNSVSKSVLRLATHIVSDLLPGVAYFPAYELLMDDLRDYRFYGADMLHPSAVAEDYVWDKFARAYFDADFGRFRKEWAAIQQSLEHRPLHAGAPEHRQFLESTREKLEQLSLRKVEVGTELAQVRTQLAALPEPQQPKSAELAEDDEERIDIGDGAPANIPVMPVQSAMNEGRPPRLSPEEFRAQRAARPERGRRDGRGKDRQALPTENEQFQTNGTAVDDQVEALRDNDSTLATAATDQVLNPAARSEALVALDSEALADGEEQAKKKKRRSRGGAKRTARKNALRLAAGELLPESETSAAPTTAGGERQPATEPSDAQAAGRKSSVITKSVPVKRGGRREEQGRVPRVPLFAAGVTPEDAEAATTVDAELPTLPVEQTFAGALPEPDNAETAELGTVPRKSRNSRNRNRKGGGRNEAGNFPTAVAELLPETGVSAGDLPIGNATQLAGTVDSLTSASMSIDNRAPESSTVAAAPASTAPVTGAVAAPVTASRQPRRKARAVSAARPEKPAIDTPVIPVRDDTMVRTQVAAGRMMGSSASLIVPTTSTKKVVATKKTGTPAKTVVIAPEIVKAAQVVPVVVEALPQAPVAKPKSTPKSRTKAVTPEPAATKATVKAKAIPAAKPVAPVAKLTVAKPVTAKKAGAKPLSTGKAPASSKAAPAAKVTKAKTLAAPVVPTKASAPKVAAPKKAAAKPAAKTDVKPATQKPKPPKKPAKPA